MAYSKVLVGYILYRNERQGQYCTCPVDRETVLRRDKVTKYANYYIKSLFASKVGRNLTLDTCSPIVQFKTRMSSSIPLKAVEFSSRLVHDMHEYVTR